MVHPIVVYAAIGAVAHWLLNDKYRKGDDDMHDSYDLIAEFHDECVFMNTDQQAQLRGHRNANRDRVKAGLERNDDPTPMRFVRQGSYAMRTIIQHPENDYDIDDGIAFRKEDLVGSHGAAKTPLDARKMVLEALGEDGRFSRKPEIKPNCVRIHYAAGYHIDMPVYRVCEDEAGTAYLELAGNEWKESDPEGVTKWFDDAASDRSPDTRKGGQLRRVVRLLKAFSKTITGTKPPSGLIISALAIDKYCYSVHENRDDISLYETMRLVYDRLCGDPDVYHPKTGECLTEGAVAARMVAFKNRLEEALEDLQVLFDEDCDEAMARKAWKKVFKHNFFDEDQKSDSHAASIGLGISMAGQAPHVAINKPSKPWGK